MRELWCESARPVGEVSRPLELSARGPLSQAPRAAQSHNGSKARQDEVEEREHAPASSSTRGPGGAAVVLSVFAYPEGFSARTLHTHTPARTRTRARIDHRFGSWGALQYFCACAATYKCPVDGTHAPGSHARACLFPRLPCYCNSRNPGNFRPDLALATRQVCRGARRAQYVSMRVHGVLRAHPRVRSRWRGDEGGLRVRSFRVGTGSLINAQRRFCVYCSLYYVLRTACVSGLILSPTSLSTVHGLVYLPTLVQYSIRRW